MKQQVKYNILSIPNKLKFDLKLYVDDSKPYNGFYKSTMNGDFYTNISLQPIMSISIVRPSEFDENGTRRRAPYNPNDTLSMGKYNYPRFVDEVRQMYEDLKTPDLYAYIDPKRKRLELNSEKANKIRKVFTISNTAVELSPTVVLPIKEDDEESEGIKIKFNNEQSTVSLAITEFKSFLHWLDNLDIDGLSLWLYGKYFDLGPSGGLVLDATSKVDIKPKNDEELPF